MHIGVISLLVAVASLHIFLNVAEAQVAVESLAGIGSAQSSTAYSQVGLQGGQAPYYPQPVYSPSVYPQPVYSPSVYPQYQVDGYPYYGPPSILGSIFQFIRNVIWKIVTFPVRVARVIKYIVFSLLGIGSDYAYGYPSYPYASATASAMF